MSQATILTSARARFCRGTRQRLRLPLTLYTILLVASPVASQPTATSPAVPGSNPRSSITDILPRPQVENKSRGALLPVDLSAVPEVEFCARPAMRSTTKMADQEIERVFTLVRTLDAAETDGFIQALRRERPDLAGLPLRMGGACRPSLQRSRHFKDAAQRVRTTLVSVSSHQPDRQADGFWESFRKELANDNALEKPRRAERNPGAPARYAALMQMLGPKEPRFRIGLVRHLAHAGSEVATHALAVLAVFDPEEEVRQAAVEALDKHGWADIADVILKGLRYPWPPVVRQAAQLAARLDRTDLVPDLVKILDEPDPRAPVLRVLGGQKTLVIRELVRLNHSRSCLLCHAPASDDMPADVLTAAVPAFDEPPLPTGPYDQQPTRPSQMARLDVTYLRQDFSIMGTAQGIDCKPMQARFDYLVRERTLPESEKTAYRRALAGEERDGLAPNQLAALKALRKLTGKDAAPNSAAWQMALTQSSASRR